MTLRRTSAQVVCSCVGEQESQHLTTKKNEQIVSLYTRPTNPREDKQQKVILLLCLAAATKCPFDAVLTTSFLVH